MLCIEILEFIDVAVVRRPHKGSDTWVSERGHIKSRCEPNVIKQLYPLVGRSPRVANLVNQTLRSQRVEVPFNLACPAHPVGGCRVAGQSLNAPEEIGDR